MHNSEFTIAAVNLTYRGTESISFLDPKIWKNLDLKVE